MKKVLIATSQYYFTQN